MDAQFQFIVTQQQDQSHLLESLLPSIPYLSEEQWLTLLASGRIQLDNVTIYENIKVSVGQKVTYVVPDYEEAEVDIGWKLLWQNHEIVAVHKPANLPVSRTTRNVYNTLIQLLRRESQWPDAHLLHRLDLETSGIILIAKTNEIAKQYQSKLPQLMARKIYRAVINGVPNWTEIRHKSFLNTIKGSDIRCQMHPVNEDAGKFSETGFKVLRQGEGVALVECELFTGRKHQIRAHLAELGFPIVGDKIYSDNGEYYLKRLADELTQDDINNWPSEHHLLHAFEIQLHDIWQIQATNIVIRDEDYSDSWVTFCANHGL